MVVLAHLQGGPGHGHGGQLRRGRRLAWAAGWDGQTLGLFQALLKQETTATLREDCDLKKFKIIGIKPPFPQFYF